MNQRLTPKKIAALQTAYKQAIYEVYADGETIQFHIGDRCQRIDSLLSQRDCSTWALITGYNPYSQCLPERENQQRHQRLIEHLQGLRLVCFDAVGKDPNRIWQPELSLFILGISRDIAIAIGKKFQQNAIVCGVKQESAELIWINKSKEQ